MKDIYVKFGNPALKGESQDKDHPDWIEVGSWRHEIIQPRAGPPSTTGGPTAERQPQAWGACGHFGGRGHR